MLIYHITYLHEWQKQEKQKDFKVASLLTEGFIHCCTHEQIEPVRQRYFSKEKNLLLLHIESKKLDCEVKFEKSTNNELYPHVYGNIKKEAIIFMEKFKDKEN